jgi:PAP2 superfamily
MRQISKRLGYPMITALALVAARPVHADAVTDWNAIMQTTVAPANPFAQARSAAIVQLAVFEAVNAINGDYEPYLGTIAGRHGASPDAAAIAAAHRTLVTLFPGSATTLDASRAQSLSAIPDGAAKNHGLAVGEAAAAAVLLLRANDGSASAASVPYTPGTDPGAWQPTPPAFAPAFLPGWGAVTPFGLREGSQFRVPPPPALITHRYARDYNEVKLVGRVDSQFRPQDRTDVAQFYAATTPVLTWNPAARQVSAARGMALSENARIFALLAMAIADGSIAVFESKYYYSYWRPVTAVWAGGIDDNDLTDPEEGWLPLIATPAFPSYPSAHASLSGGARAVLERAFGHRGLAITLSNPALPSVVLHYTAWRQITHDIDDARIYGGIHFRYDQEAGALQGRKVGRYILRHYLRSGDDDDDDDDDD